MYGGFFELRHQNYLYTTNTGVFVVGSFQSADISNLDWENAKQDYADSLLTSSQNGNTIEHHQVSRQGTTGKNQDGQLVSLWRSGMVIPRERDGIVVLTFNIDYQTGNFEFPRTWDFFGLAEYRTESLALTDINTFKAKIGTGHQGGKNETKWTSNNGIIAGHIGQVIIVKRGLNIQTIVQVEGQVNSANSKLLTNVDLAVMLQLNGRYLNAKKVGEYSIQEVILI